jgi:hypothetical protein
MAQSDGSAFHTAIFAYANLSRKVTSLTLFFENGLGLGARRVRPRCSRDEGNLRFAEAFYPVR